MSENYEAWLWEKTGQECVANLKKHKFDAHLVPTAEEAKRLIMGMISGYETFGITGSATTRQLGLLDELKRMGKTIHDHHEPGLTLEQNIQERLAQGRSDCLLLSANAVSATGEIVNVDGIGNRTAAMSFGPKKVVIPVGINKVTKDLQSALDRVTNVAGPMRAKSLGMETPCAETGVCTDCNVPQRICNITTILHRKPGLTDISVIVVLEPLGY